jgi:hypothetical protein
MKSYRRAGRPNRWFQILIFSGVALVSASAMAEAGDSLKGRWDLTIEEKPDKQLPSWLELTEVGAVWKANFVGRWGNSRPLPKVEVDGNNIMFVSPQQEEGSTNDLVFNGELQAQTLVGSAKGPNGVEWKWAGKRAPELKANSKIEWGKPITLFNGHDFEGWTFDNPAKASSWVVKGRLFDQMNLRGRTSRRTGNSRTSNCTSR